MRIINNQSSDMIEAGDASSFISLEGINLLDES